MIGFRVGPGPPAWRWCGAGLAVKGAFGVAGAMGFAHPGLRSLPRRSAGYRVARPNGVRLPLHVAPYLVQHWHLYADNVNTNRVQLEPGDRIDMRSPVTGHPHVPDAPPTGLTVYAVTTDPQLGRISTPNGTVQFLQVLGVTAAEKERMIASSTAQVLTGLARNNPLLITDPNRA